MLVGELTHLRPPSTGRYLSLDVSFPPFVDFSFAGHPFDTIKVRFQNPEFVGKYGSTTLAFRESQPRLS